MDIFITSFVTLFLIVDPIGLAPMFIALTTGMPLSLRRSIALRACLVALFILAMFALVGDELLHFIGIGLPAFRIAGGLLLFLTAVEMLFNKRGQRREETAESETFEDPSVFPLATPLIAGPGAMAAMILLTGETSNYSDMSYVLLAMFCVLLIAFFLFFFSTFLEKLLGQTGINVITRLFGMLLAALAVQFVIDGLRGLGILT